MDISKLSDIELNERIAELHKVKNARETERELEQQRKHTEYLLQFQNALTTKVIDVLAPEHRKSRYHMKDCSDENVIGASRKRDEPKEFYCPRCSLIEFVQLEDYELDDVYVDITINISAPRLYYF